MESGNSFLAVNRPLIFILVPGISTVERHGRKVAHRTVNSEQ